MTRISLLFTVVLSLSVVSTAHAQVTPSTNSGTVTAHEAATENPSTIPGLLLVGTRGERAVVTSAELQTMPRHTVHVRNGHTGVSEEYEGVLLVDLLAKINAPLGKQLHGGALAVYLSAEGTDSYQALYSLAEVDPSFHPGTVIVADRMDGQPLGAKDGPMKLVNTEDLRPARDVHNLASIHLIATR